MQSIEPELSSMSFASQLMGFATNFQPLRAQTSRARSRSKPLYSLPSLNPYGGKSASNPTVNFLVPSSFSPHPAMTTDMAASATAVSIFIFVFSFCVVF